MSEKTLYEILEVSPKASGASLRNAYEMLSAQHDPDDEKNRGNAEARLRYEAVKEAYLTLSNPDKRAQYDRQIEARARATLRNVQVATPFWTTPRLAVLALIVIVSGGYYYKYKQEEARLQAEREIAAAKAREAEEKARAEIEQAQMQLRREQEQRAAEHRERMEREAALRQLGSQQTREGYSADRERLAKQREEAQRKLEEQRAAIAARQQLARERAELCRIERERYGRAISC